MEPAHHISPEILTIEKIEEIVEKNLRIELSGQSVKLIEDCQHYLSDKLKSHSDPIYGVTTGFGALHNKVISSEEITRLQKNLIMSHACGTGETISIDIVRLMILLKIQGLSLGRSGVNNLTINRLISFYNEGVTPVVYEFGSLGASGDLAPLAHLSLPLLGMGEVDYRGKRIRGEELKKIFGWEPLEMGPKEGLALLNGTQFMSAHGIYVLLRLKKLFKAINLVSALSLDAYDGRSEPFESCLHTIRPYKGQIAVSSSMRRILDGSSLLSRAKKHVQDPYSFRCIPQVHGASLDAADHAAAVLLTEVNSVTDNPTIFHEDDRVLSGGNFHGQPLALVFDYLAIAIAELGSISERRIYRLIAGERGLPEFLTPKPGLNSGFMIPQYTAASIVSRNKQLCSPASIDSIPSSNEQEDHVSMGANGATRLVRVLENVERVIAIELMTAAQALEFRRPARSSVIIESLVDDYRKVVPFMEHDRVIYPDIESSIQFIRNI